MHHAAPPQAAVPERHFDLVSHWRIGAPVERVWAALADAETWPHWWPSVRAVHSLKNGDADGLGGVRRIEWAARLPYGRVLEIERVEALRPERLRARARGRLQGEGIWLLREDVHEDPGFTHVTYVWRMHAMRPWMRWLAPLLRFSHARVMREGAAGLARHLQVLQVPDGRG